MNGLFSAGRSCSSKLNRFRSAGISNKIPASALPDWAQPKEVKYTDKTPLKLVRVNKGPSKKVRLRSKATKQNPHSTDVILSADGLVHPSGPANLADAHQRRRNGMMMIAPTPFYLLEYLDLMGSKCTVLEIPAGTPIPEGLVLHRKCPEIYSLEPSEPCTPRELNKMLSEFLVPLKAFSKAEYFQAAVSHRNAKK